MTKADKIKQILNRGVETIISRKDLQKQLAGNKKLRLKLGLDPTGPKIHIGRAIVLWKLRAFQNLGHKIVLLIGDFTALIGDASDKQAQRPVLSEAQIKRNLKDYQKQLGLILDMSKVELHYNSEWLNKLSAKDLIKLAMNFSVYQMIERRNFKQRFAAKKEIGLHEILYPLLQAYDSVAIKADVELGGSDQLFNLLAGRKIQPMYGQKSQQVMTTRMLDGLDGRKMSTSWGNVINLLDSPSDQFGKIMSMRDEMIIEYFTLCTDLPMTEIKQMEQALKAGQLNPRDAKIKLGQEIVKMYHGARPAAKAVQEFARIFKQKQAPTKVPAVKVPAGRYPALDLLVKAKLAVSKSEAKRLIEQGGVKIDKQIITDWQARVQAKPGMLIQVGKRRFVKISG